jgi:MFS family permease
VDSAATPLRSDRRILFLSAFLRATATGQMGVLLGLYLSRLRMEGRSADFIVAAGLAGAAAAALFVTILGNRLHRKATLLTLAVLSAAGAAAAAGSSDPLILGVIAFAGMLNGMGRDRGASLVLEQALLPATTDDRGRTRVFALYSMLQDIGHATGSLAAGFPSLLQRLGWADETVAMRWALLFSSALYLLSALAYLPLSPGLVLPPKEKIVVSPESRRVLWRLSALFALDSLGGGFLVTAMLTYFFVGRFQVGGVVVSALFFGARVLNAISHLGAAWLSRRIGLVNTMVLTHIPSSLFLATVPFAPNFWVAAVLFLLREGLVEMDVPTRQSYVMAVVKPEERTFASGMTHLVRMGMWALGPTFAGLFRGVLAASGPIFAGAGLKIAYDVLLYVSFRNLKPPEEQKHGQD